MNLFPITSPPLDIGKGYAVTFTFDGTRLDCEWSPRMPYGRRGRSLLPAYKLARTLFLGKVAVVTGQNIAVVDMPAGEVRS